MICNINNILYIVPTPIGNLLDISIRAIIILKKVDIILAENFNRIQILLNKYNIKKKILILNKHNELKITNFIINKLIFKYLKLALVSNAGTPLINDPGAFLINKCINLGIKIITLPGACAAISALVSSGLNCNKFIYEGFLPKNNSLKTKLLTQLSKESRTIICYESCHRLLNTIKNFIDIFGGDRQIAIIKELTKIWENIYRGTCKHIYQILSTNIIKGEYVIIIQGYKSIIKHNTITPIIQQVFMILNKKYSYKDSINLIVKLFNLEKNMSYSFFLKKNNYNNML